MVGKNYKKEIKYIDMGETKKAIDLIDRQIRHARVFWHEAKELTILLENHYRVLDAADRCLRINDVRGAKINLNNAEKYLKKAEVMTKRLFEEEKISE